MRQRDNARIGRRDGRPCNQLAGLAGPELLAGASDERLVALAGDGDENAFAAIVARYQVALERHCRRTLPPSRAEDALQQTFTSAYVALRGGAAPAALRPWLFAIAHNAAVDGLRDRQAYDLDRLTYPAGADPTCDVVTQREALRAVLRALAALPSRQRHVIVRQEFDGRSHEQIAAELGLTRGAVRQLAHRARSSVRAAAALAPVPLAERVHGMPRLPHLSHMLGFLDPAVGGGTALLAKVGVSVALATATGQTAQIPAAFTTTAVDPPAHVQHQQQAGNQQ